MPSARSCRDAGSFAVRMCQYRLQHGETGVSGVSGTGGYRLGPTPSLLVRSGAYKQYIVQTAAPFLEELVRRINENCLIVTHSDGKRVVLLTRKSSRELQLNEPLMTENLMHTATGCVMLAHMSGEELERYESVQPFAGSIFPAVTSWSGFRAKLAGIRAGRNRVRQSGRRFGWSPRAGGSRVS